MSTNLVAGQFDFARHQPHVPLSSSPPSPQTIKAAAVYSLVFGPLSPLVLNESDAKKIAEAYELSPDAQLALGYRSCPEPLTFRIPQLNGRDLSLDEVAEMKRTAHQPLDKLNDDEFLDWFTYPPRVPNDPKDFSKGTHLQTIADLERETFSKVSYRVETLSTAQVAIESEIVSRLGRVEDVAGVYYSDDHLRVKLPERGLLAPVRRGGLIRSLAWYPRPGHLLSYPLTSNGLPGGTKASPSIHVVNPQHAHESGYLVLTDHTVAADALAATGPTTIVARNGLTPGAAKEQLHDCFPRLHSVLLHTLEVDWSLVNHLRKAGLTVEVADE